MFPACFESQEQYDKWLEADNSTYHYHGGTHGADRRATPFCIDCTPTYAALMRLAERCEHPEVRFYRSGKAFRGGTTGRPGVKSHVDNDGNWELCDGAETQNEEQSDAEVPGPHEGAGIPLRDHGAPAP